jgi:ABC-type oligopeptide transport system substrate-binding subunit
LYLDFYNFFVSNTVATSNSLVFPATEYLITNIVDAIIRITKNPQLRDALQQIFDQTEYNSTQIQAIKEAATQTLLEDTYPRRTIYLDRMQNPLI